jgi:hypothetical protein
MPQPWLDAGVPEQIDALIARVRAYNAQLVCIDNLGLISGGRDENTSGMIQVLQGLRRLAESTGAAVVPVHHQRKNTGIVARAGDALRGYSGIEAAFDLCLVVSREQGSNLIEIKSTKTRDIDVPPFGAYFEYSWKPGTKELATATFYGQQVIDDQSDRAIESTIIDVLTDTPDITQTKLKDAVQEALPKVGKHRVIAVLDRLAATNKLATKKGKRNAWIYSLPS